MERSGIYVNQLDGSGDIRLTGLDRPASGGSWKPAGATIAYALADDPGANIYTMDRRGRPLAQITHGREYKLSPSWHPRGTAVAFRSEIRPMNIHTIQVDGSDERQLTKHPTPDWNPRWSPDGTEILFASDRDGSGELYIVDADGGNIRRVTFGRFHNYFGYDWFDPDFPRSVSPVGRRATTWGWLKRVGTPNS